MSRKIFQNENFSFYKETKNGLEEYYLDIIIDNELINTINIQPQLACNLLELISHDNNPNNHLQQMKEALNERTYVKTLIFDYLDSKEIINYFL